jgi:T-complex protein 1 subunit eta
MWFGIDVVNEGICDTMLSHVWEPAANRINSIAAATEAACLVLSVDEVFVHFSSDRPV